MSLSTRDHSRSMIDSAARLGRRAGAATTLCLLVLATAYGDDDPLRLSDQPKPLQTATFPARPRPIVEIGQNPFLGSGYIAPGFELPTGAVWQPVLIAYGDVRSALQTVDNGPTQTTEWVNRIDLYANLYLTPTERIFAGLRPLDKNGKFTGYQFKPDNANKGWNSEFNGTLNSLFFEGDFGELFPNLDPKDTRSLDYGFCIGRQDFVFQDGALINDTIDAIGITRSSLFTGGATAARFTGVFGWNNVNRGNVARANDARLYGLFSAFDTYHWTIDADVVYVTAPAAQGGDGLFFGLSGVRRLFGRVNSTTRALASIAVDHESAAVGNGELFLQQLSITPPGGDNLLYWDFFYSVDNYTPAARGPGFGAPVGNTGILFANLGLGSYIGPLTTSTTDSVGSALGYQMFLSATKQQIIVEVGGRQQTKGDSKQEYAVGARWQRAFGRHLIIQFDGFIGDRNGTTIDGLRTELFVKF